MRKRRGDEEQEDAGDEIARISKKWTDNNEDILLKLLLWLWCGGDDADADADADGDDGPGAVEPHQNCFQHSQASWVLVNCEVSCDWRFQLLPIPC